MRPYSMDLRERVAAAVDEGESPQREIARLFRVSVSFVSRLLQRRRQKDTLAPKPHGGGPTPVLSPDDQRRLEHLIQEHNDDTLDQLRLQGGFDCSLTTIWRALRRCGLTSKKKTQHADERDRSDVREKRRSFRRKVKRVEPNDYGLESAKPDLQSTFKNPGGGVVRRAPRACAHDKKWGLLRYVILAQRGESRTWN